MRRLMRALAVLGLMLGSLFAFSQTAAQARPCGDAYPPSLCYPTISVSTTTPFVGETITISGDAFYSNEDVKLYIGGKFVATAHTDANGDFAGVPAVTPDLPGPREVKGVGASGQPDDVATTDLTIRVPGHGTEGEGLASTGAKVAGLGVIAVVLIAGGALLARAGRRKPSTR